MRPDFKELSKGEQSRTYFFPTPECIQSVTVQGVARLAVSASGTHRLETVKGGKYIIPTGWVSLKIDAEDWSI